MKKSNLTKLTLSKNQSHHWRATSLANVFWSDNASGSGPRGSLLTLQVDTTLSNNTETYSTERNEDGSETAEKKRIEEAIRLNSELFTYKPKNPLVLHTNTKSHRWQSADFWGKHMSQASKNIERTPRILFHHNRQTTNDTNEEEDDEEFSLDEALNTIEKKVHLQIERVEHWEDDKEVNDIQKKENCDIDKEEEEQEMLHAPDLEEDTYSELSEKVDVAMHKVERLRNQELSSSQQHTQVQLETVSKYEKSSRFLKSNLLSVRSSLLRANESAIRNNNVGDSLHSTVSKHDINVEYTRACMERANVAKEIASLLDRITMLLPEMNKPMPLSPIESNPHHRERRVREAAKNYGVRSRNLAKYKKNILKKKAYNNRTKYFALRRTRAEAEEERRKRITKERQITRDQQRHTGKIVLPPKEWEIPHKKKKKQLHSSSINTTTDDDYNNYNSDGNYDNYCSDDEISNTSSFLFNKQQHVDAMSMELSIQQQHRADRLIESRKTLASNTNNTWKEDVETDLQSPGIQGIRKPKLLKTGQRALSPLLSSSKHSSSTLLKYAASSPNLSSRLSSPGLPESPFESSIEGEYDVNNNLLSQVTFDNNSIVVNTHSSDNPKLYYDLTINHDTPPVKDSYTHSMNFNGRSLSFSPHKPNLKHIKSTVPSHNLSHHHSTTNDTTLTHDSFDSTDKHFVEAKNDQQSTLKHHHGFQGPQATCLLRAIPETSKERMIRVALVEMNIKVSKIKTTRWKQLEDGLNQIHFNERYATPAPIDATTVRHVIRDVISSNKNGHSKMTKSPIINNNEYVPYAERKKKKSSSNTTSSNSTSSMQPISQSLLQRQVAKKQRAMSQRQMSHARRLDRQEFSIQKQDFERKIRRSIKNRKWEKE
jgi:hypothetical protein